MSKGKHMIPDDYASLLVEVKERVRAAQYEALRAVNKELVALYWDIGRIVCERQSGGAGWGKSVVERLAADLRAEFPGVLGFSAQNLWYMCQFYTAYHGHAKLQPLVGEISWAKHLVILGKCGDPLEREFYIRMTKKFGWTKNVPTRIFHQGSLRNGGDARVYKAHDRGSRRRILQYVEEADRVEHSRHGHIHHRSRFLVKYPG